MAFFSMTGLVLKSLFRKPITRKYPFEKREPFARSRGSIEIDINACIFCGICKRRCPSLAIDVIKEDKIWEIERLRCISCNYCVECCPKKCLSMNTSYTAPTTKRTTEVYQQKSTPKPETKPEA
jgi:ech hydrogenase subunit F